ncbi:MAG TPA: DUF488 domain-containing protein [Gammaproteobacteria bacterium]
MTVTRLHTLGHSNRSLEEFIALLRSADLRILVDVRAQPQSSRYPHFGQESLRDALTAAGIDYHWAGRQLGGHRPARADSRHTALPEDGLRGYADYMDGDLFKKAAVQLIGLARRAPCVILCAEREPLDCHRSLIADYLTLQGVEIRHLIDSGDTRPHQLRQEVRRESQQLVYDRHTTAELPLGD